jgi:hypothetical protein
MSYRDDALTKRKQALLAHSAMAPVPKLSLFDPLPERALVINVSAALRRFYSALAEIEGKRRGCFLTAADIIREMREP